MTYAEKALELVKARRARREAERLAVLDSLKSDPEFNAKYVALTGANCALIAERDEGRQASLRMKSESLRKELDESVRRRGISIDPFKETFFCPICRDSGRVESGLCECAERLRIELALEDSPPLRNIPDGPDAIDYSFYGKAADEKRRIARFLSSELKAGKKIFLLTGKTGTGKTYVAGALVRQMLREGREIFAKSATELNRAFLACVLADISRKDALWRDLVEPEIMLIDDLGVERILNNVTVPCLLDLICSRMDDKITIITTNLEPLDIERKYGQRILSRLLDKRRAAAAPFAGDDLRLS